MKRHSTGRAVYCGLLLLAGLGSATQASGGLQSQAAKYLFFSNLFEVLGEGAAPSSYFPEMKSYNSGATADTETTVEVTSSHNKSESLRSESKSHNESAVISQTKTQGLSQDGPEQLLNPIKRDSFGIIESGSTVGKANRSKKTIKKKRVSRRKKSRNSSSSKRASEILTKTRVADLTGLSTNWLEASKTSQNLPWLLPIIYTAHSYGNLLPATHILKDVSIPSIYNFDANAYPTDLNSSIDSKGNISLTQGNISLTQGDISLTQGNISLTQGAGRANLILATKSSDNSTDSGDNGQVTTETPILGINSTKPIFILNKETPTTNKSLVSTKSGEGRPSVLINKFSRSRSSRRSSSHVSSSSTTHEISEIIVHEYDFTDVETKKPKPIRREGGPRFFLIRETPTNSSEKITSKARPKIVPRRIVSKVSKTNTSSTSTNSSSEETSSSSKQILIKGAIKNNATLGISKKNDLNKDSEIQGPETESKTIENSVLKDTGLKLDGQRGKQQGLAGDTENFSIAGKKKRRNLRKSLRKVSRKKKKSKLSKKSSTTKTVATNAIINT